MKWWLIIIVIVMQIAALVLALTADNLYDFAYSAFMVLLVGRMFRLDLERVLEEHVEPIIVIVLGIIVIVLFAISLVYVMEAEDMLSFAKAALLAWLLAPRLTIHAE